MEWIWPIVSNLPPDALSRAVTFYAFALLDKHKEEADEALEEEKEYVDSDKEGEDDNGGSIMIVEDELGLDTTTKYEFQEAIEYICTKVKSTLSPTNEEQSYITAGTVQRARTELPDVWLHGVRIEAVFDISDELLLLDDDRKKNSSSIGIGMFGR